MGPDCHGLTPWRQQVGRPPDGAYVLDAGEGRSEPAAGSGLCTLGKAVRAGPVWQPYLLGHGDVGELEG